MNELPPLLSEAEVVALTTELRGGTACRRVREPAPRSRPETSRSVFGAVTESEWFLCNGLLRAEKIQLPGRPASEPAASTVITGADPDFAGQEIVLSSHVDPGRFETGGSVALGKAALALAGLIDRGELPPPRRTVRLLWLPNEVGTLTLLSAQPELAARARAVVHVGRVGSTEAAGPGLRLIASPRSLPSVLDDVAEALGRYVERVSRSAAEGSDADRRLVGLHGGEEPLRFRVEDFSTESTDRLWTNCLVRVPAIFVGVPERPSRFGADGRLAALDRTQILGAAFVAAATSYVTSRIGEEEVPGLIRIVKRHGLERMAQALARAELLHGTERKNLLEQQVDHELSVLKSIAAFVAWPPKSLEVMKRWVDTLRRFSTDETGSSAPAPGESSEVASRLFRMPAGAARAAWESGSPSLEEYIAERKLQRPALLDYRGLWGDGRDYAFEALNLIDGRRTVGKIRDRLAATYGPVPVDLVGGFLETMRDASVLEHAPPHHDLGWVGGSTRPLAARAPRFPPPESAFELGLAGYAKVLCTAIFVCGREPEEARRNCGHLFLRKTDYDAITKVTVDREKGEVRVTGGDQLTRTARLCGDQGAVILPRGTNEVFFETVAVESRLPNLTNREWPTGDRLPDDAPPPAIDRERLAKAVDLAFSDPEALTAAFLVLHKGRIIAERYDLGADRHTQLESWSMGKGLVAALVGVLVQRGALALRAPAPVPAWQRAGDPRSEIRVIDLLRMSSGLHFIAPQDPDYGPERGYDDHTYIYTGAIDSFEFTVSRPLQFPPGTRGRYRNCDPVILGYLIRESARILGEDYLSFPQRALFDRIGIRQQLLETDPYGNLQLTDFSYGTARNWARLALLFLRDGLWEGERVLPEGWSEVVSTPAPAWRNASYGGLFWLNRRGQLNIPADAYYMTGVAGQFGIIVPSLDLVVVRMGRLRGGTDLSLAGPGPQTLNKALSELTAALPDRSRR